MDSQQGSRLHLVPKSEARKWSQVRINPVITEHISNVDKLKLVKLANWGLVLAVSKKWRFFQKCSKVIKNNHLALVV